MYLTSNTHLYLLLQSNTETCQLSEVKVKMLGHLDKCLCSLSYLVYDKDLEKCLYSDESEYDKNEFEMSILRREWESNKNAVWKSPLGVYYRIVELPVMTHVQVSFLL